MLFRSIFLTIVFSVVFFNAFCMDDDFFGPVRPEAGSAVVFERTDSAGNKEEFRVPQRGNNRPERRRRIALTREEALRIIDRGRRK
ncbi:MAG: hypothetical protein ABIF12_02410 [bacterium]